MLTYEQRLANLYALIQSNEIMLEIAIDDNDSRAVANIRRKIDEMKAEARQMETERFSPSALCH